MARDAERQRAAKRRYYDRNKVVYLQRNRLKRDELREIIRAAKEVPCADCGGQYPYYVMDFDHRAEGEKVIEVAQIVALNWNKNRLLAEIEKCDIVCSNCHRIRTHERGQNKGRWRVV